MEYRTQDGLIVPKHKTSLHHVFSERGWYRTDAEKRFCSMGGMVLRMTNETHNFGPKSLHANVGHPPKPSRPFMEQIVEFAHDVYDNDDYDAFHRIVHFIGDVANTSWSAERADEAYRLHENLVAQSVYIEAGRVEPVYARV